LSATIRNSSKPEPNLHINDSLLRGGLFEDADDDATLAKLPYWNPYAPGPELPLNDPLLALFDFLRCGIAIALLDVACEDEAMASNAQLEICQDKMNERKR
jgi:hypothetical protein